MSVIHETTPQVGRDRDLNQDSVYLAQRFVLSFDAVGVGIKGPIRRLCSFKDVFSEFGVMNGQLFVAFSPNVHEILKVDRFGVRIRLVDELEWSPYPKKDNVGVGEPMPQSRCQSQQVSRVHVKLEHNHIVVVLFSHHAVRAERWVLWPRRSNG